MFYLTKKNKRFLSLFFNIVYHFFCIFILSKYRIEYHDNGLISPIYDICQMMREYEIRYLSDNVAHPWSWRSSKARMVIRVIRRRFILVSSQCPSWPACWRARRPAGTTHLDWRLPVTRPCYAVDWGSRCCIRGAEWGRFVQPLAGFGFLGSTSPTRVPRSLVSAELSTGCLLIPVGKNYFWASQILQKFWLDKSFQIAP